MKRRRPPRTRAAWNRPSPRTISTSSAACAFPSKATRETAPGRTQGSANVQPAGGELELHNADQECSLGAGDAVYFDASTPHSYQCAGKKPAGAIIVTMHQAPDQ